MLYDRKASVIAYTNANGYKDYYPGYRIYLDGDVIASQFDHSDIDAKTIQRAIDESMDEIEAAIQTIVNRHLRGSVFSPTHCFVNATIQHEFWDDHDYLVYGDGDEFNCVLALDSFDLSELPPCADMIHGDDERFVCEDEVFTTAVRLGQVDDWEGPFDLYVNERDYDEYLRERVLNEYGCELLN